MCDPLGSRRLADVVGARVQGQVHDAARVGRDVAGRAVHEVAVEHQHAAGLAGGRDDAALLHQPLDRVIVECPERIGGRLLVVAGLQVAVLLRTRHQHQGAVDGQHLVEEHGDVHGAGLRHAVVAQPGAVVLMPLPDVAVELGFGVDLELMHVDPLAEHLLDGVDHARVAAEDRERLVVGVGRKRRARGAVLLAPDLRTVAGEHGSAFLAQDGDLFGGEQLGQEQPAFGLELLDLGLGQMHGFAPG